MKNHKLFLIVRKDLSLAQQAVQAAHALQEFNHIFPDKAKKWYMESNTLAILEVSDEKELHEMLLKAKVNGIANVGFREPDIGMSLTAVALESKAHNLCKKLKLAMRV